MFALVDANSFYCSAEQVFRPDWRGKPMVVLSNNDGCIVAANRQATDLGIEKFKPFFQMKGQCNRHGVIVCSSNYELYSDISNKMMQVIGRFAPRQHIYSIDESFLCFKDCQSLFSLQNQALTIRKTVWKECRLPVCVGIGNTLTLAKAANFAAKKLDGYHGTCVIDSEKERVNILSQMAVDHIWGIGRRLCVKLKNQHIYTALDLSKQSSSLMRRSYSVEMERIVLELNGHSCKQWDKVRADKQQIFSTRSVGKRITNIDELHQALCKHASIAAAKLRSQGSLCSVMMLFAASSPHDEQPVSTKRLCRFAFPTDDSREMLNVISSVISDLYKTNTAFYKIGVGLLDLQSSQYSQADLFAQRLYHPKLMQTLDKINTRYGRDSLFLAAQGINPQWQMRRTFLSPQYTSNWHDIPCIKC